MGFNLGTSSNTGKLHMTDFLKSDNAVQNTEKEIPINQLVPWENQPFKMYSEFKLHELAESIKENGLLSPIIVCPLDNGKYRIIAGHNRVEACKIAGITNIPSVIKDVDENRAKLMMADTNLCQRTELLPSERAYAYKAQHEALIALGSPRSTAAIAEKYGEGRATVQRYIACSRLVPELMNLLDSGRINLLPAVSFSGMPDESQRGIASYLNRFPDRKISAEQAEELASLKFVSESDIIELYDGTPKSDEKRSDSNSAQEPVKQNTEKKKSSPNQYSKKITLKRKEVTEIIGDELTNDEISEFFYFCLQKSDFLSEWRKMYLETQQETSDNILNDDDEDEDEDEEQEL